jgi:VWFA-related protein
MRSTAGTLFLAAVLAAGLPVPRELIAQEVTVQEAAEPAGVEGAFVDTLEVQAVNVEVVVTDRNGDRVTDLTAADFRLLVDGKPVPLDYFAEVRDGRPVAAPGAEEAALPPALTDLGAGEEVGTSYLVFIDEFFSPPRLRNEALKVLARDLHLLGPRDRMAVVAFDSKRLRVITDWTSPGAALEQTLRTAARGRGHLHASDFGVASDLKPLRLNGETLEVDNSLQAADYEGEALQSSVARDVVLAAAGALRTFDPPAGRKVALILSGGWMVESRRPDSDMRAIQESFAVRGGFPVLRPLTDAANLLGYTVYPIQLEDMQLPGAGDRDQGNTTMFTNMSRNAMTHVMRQSGLIFSAEETGGRFLKAGAPHLKRISEDTRSYYWLGFTSTAADNKRRNLEVELVRSQTEKGLKVRSRSSFLPLSRGTRSAMMVEGALLTGRAIPHSKAMEVLLGKAEKAGPLTAQLPLTFRIPAEAITFLPQEGRLIAHLQLWIASIDQQGRRSDVTVTPISFAVAEAPGKGQRVVYRSDIMVRRAEQEVQFALIDAQSGETLSARIRLDLDR